MSNGKCLDCNVIAYDKDREIGIELTKKEASAIVKELGKTFIDRDNPLCNEVLTKLMRFVNESGSTHK